MTTGTGADKTRRSAIGRAPLVTAATLCILAASSVAGAENKKSGRNRCFDTTTAPVTIGANWQLTGIGIDPEVQRAAEQIEVVKSEINGSCGVRVQAGKVGVPLAVLVRDNQSTVAGATAVTQQLIEAGAVALVGGGNSVLAPPAVQAAVQANITFGVNQAAADSLSGCTAAELGDPAVIKSATPVYAPGLCWDHHGLVFRTTTTGHLGGMAAARYARATYPTLTDAAFLFRNDDFGRPNRDGFRDTFVELGGTVLAEGAFPLQATLDDFKTLLRTVTAGNPSIVAANPNVSRLKLIMQAYVELRDDPTWTAKPLNFDTLRLVWTATATSGTFSDLSAAALAALVNQSESVQSAWDPNSVGFQKWFALYRAFKPDAEPPVSSFAMTAYDALVVMALAITAAGTTDAPAIAAKLKEITNPPGKCVYPGEWKKAFKRLTKGKDINYQGALGPVDLDERGNATGIAHGIFRFLPDGSTTMVGTFASAPQQSACDTEREDGDEDDEGNDDD
jgi:ABC-type branched-subunit amino acid transport system substrate-binding protein